MLQVVVFSIIFGIALAMLGDDKRRPMLLFCESLSETMFKFTNIVMLFAPIGVAGAIAYTVGTMGFGVMVNLIKLLATLYAALFVFLTCVLLPVAAIARIPIRGFIKAIAEPVSIAFATASSEAALPRAMESMEAFGVPRPIVAFVMPTGYSFNLDGTTVYLALASMFVAQAAGIHLSIGQQLVMVFTLMLTSKGVAGVPARQSGDFAGNGGIFPSACLADPDHHGHRSTHGHGAHGYERTGQLPGYCRGRAMGRRIRQRDAVAGGDGSLWRSSDY